MLKIKCLGIRATPRGYEYHICDPQGNKKILTTRQLCFILNTKQAECDNLEYTNGVFRLREPKPPVSRVKSDLSPVQEYMIFRTRQKLMGIDIDKYYAIEGDDVCLVKCPIIEGTYTIPSFVTKFSNHTRYPYTSPFKACIELKVRNESCISDMSELFSGCNDLCVLDLSDFDTSKVTSMHSMFSFCQSLTTLITTGIDTSNVTDMGYMFDTCKKLRVLDLRSFNTGKVKTMEDMFRGCFALQFLNLSSFDTSNVEIMRYMFCLCSSLEKLDLSSFNTSRVTEFEGMFYGCSSLLGLDLGNFDTHEALRMSEMFCDCRSLQQLGIHNFSIGKQCNVSHMFNGCPADIRAMGEKKIGNRGWTP